MSQTRTPTAEPAAGTREFRVIGTRPVRHDGTDKVTGRALYGADIRLPGMLYGAVARSPHAHARIRSIDASAALAMPGVLAVVTAADLPQLTADKISDLGESAMGLKHMSQLILAHDKALFKGHPVAAVAATSPHVAEEAALKLRVSYDPLPLVLDVRQAMDPAAPLLHEDLFTRSLGKRAERPSNVAQHVQHLRGDVEAGFQQADVIVEREFQTEMVHQGYIEPQNATAQVSPDGQITVWTSTQGAFVVRSQVSELLEIPVSRIKVVPLEIGGGFGGKIQVYLEPLAVMLSARTGRPVKMVMTRDEVFQATGPASGTYSRVKIGARRDGQIVAAQAYLVYEAGAFPGSPVGPGSLTCLSPYAIPHVRIDGYDVVVNKPRVSAYRAPGSPQAAFAVEQVIDELASRLQMDPVRLRLQNASGDGDRRTDGVQFPRIGFKQLLEAVAEHPHYSAPLGDPPPGMKRGRGVAAGFWMNNGGPSSCHLSVNSDGTVTLVEGSTDIGGSRASMAMIAAEELGLRAEDVKPIVGDTDAVGFTEVTGGSRVTYATGTAVWTAAQEIKAQMIERAAKLMQVAPADIEFDAGVFSVKPGAQPLTFAQVAAAMNKTGGPIAAKGTVNMPGRAPGFAAHIVDLDVDVDTGKVRIVRYTALQDVGKAIHPSYVEGQMQGGVAQGIGWALNEAYVFDEAGALRNPTLLDYRMPTALDVPMIETHYIEVPASEGPYGVRGVGEAPIIPPPAAIANAIHAATGVRFTRLPMSPERVCSALQAGARTTAAD